MQGGRYVAETLINFCDYIVIFIFENKSRIIALYVRVQEFCLSPIALFPVSRRDLADVRCL